MRGNTSTNSNNNNRNGQGNTKSNQSGNGKAVAVGALTVTRSALPPNTISVLCPPRAEQSAENEKPPLPEREGDVRMAMNMSIRDANNHAKNGEGLLIKSMARDPAEPAETTIDRIRLLFAPPRDKRSSAAIAAGKRGSKEDMLATCPRLLGFADPSVTAASLDASAPTAATPLDSSLPNSEFWKQARVVILGDETVRVRYNVPTITRVDPPSRPFVGLPVICPRVDVLFAEKEAVRYEWGLRTPSSTAAEVGSARTEEKNKFQVLSREAAFEPTESLLGKRLVLRVSVDGSDSLSTTQQEQQQRQWTEVELPPVQQPAAPVARWQETTTDVAFPGFRVVTYNILYDDFCTSKSSKEKIYPFATDEVLDLENRKVRILQELLAYHADIICLQECGRKVFEDYLRPAMDVRGYVGFYANKSGSVQEGCGYLFRRERFTLVSADVVSLNWATLLAREPALAARIEAHAELQEALAKVTTISAVLTLKETSTGKPLVLGNTHLFYHANACHIRILQAYLLISCLRTAAADAMASVPESEDVYGASEHKTTSSLLAPVVLCGDCNFTHSTGAYRLVTTGQVEDTHHSWEKGKLFWWGCDRQLGYNEDQLAEFLGEADNGHPSKKNPAAADTARKRAEKAAREPLATFFQESLHGGLKLMDSYGRTDPSLPWTNFTLTFREVIDYIFFSEDSIDVLRTVPIPPESELAENFALPNAKYPSDHIALISDLAFKN